MAGCGSHRQQGHRNSDLAVEHYHRKTFATECVNLCLSGQRPTLINYTVLLRLRSLSYDIRNIWCFPLSLYLCFLDVLYMSTLISYLFLLSFLKQIINLHRHVYRELYQRTIVFTKLTHNFASNLLVSDGQ